VISCCCISSPEKPRAALKPPFGISGPIVLPATLASFGGPQLSEGGVRVSQGLTPIAAVVMGCFLQLLSGYLKGANGFVDSGATAGRLWSGLGNGRGERHQTEHKRY
jgi:hypothetical protein